MNTVQLNDRHEMDLLTIDRKAPGLLLVARRVDGGVRIQLVTDDAMGSLVAAVTFDPVTGKAACDEAPGQSYIHVYGQD